MRNSRSSILLTLLCATVAAGCSAGSPLHQRYSNFLAYFNTYYNAERKLDEGLQSLEQRREVIDRTRFVSVFPSPATSGQGAAFQEAIEKASDLLRNRPGSAYADDALFLIGKAYFYQQNFSGAEEKFREALLLTEEEGNARAADESRFWLARTLSAAGAYDEGVTVIRERLSDEDVDRRWRPRLQLAMGELLARAERYEEAVDVLKAGLEHVGDRNVAARAGLLLGQILEELGRFEGAVEAYRAAEARHADYEITYAARLNRALVLGLDLERHAEAVELIQEMRNDGKNYENRAEVELTYARLLAASGQTEKADARFDAILYDEALGASSIRGKVHYRLAEWHRDVRKDYERAAAHFDTAATALQISSEIAEARHTREAMLDAQDEARRLGAYAEAARKLAEADSLLELAYLDDAAFQQRISEIETQRRAEYLADLERRGHLEERQNFGGAVAEDPTRRGAPRGEVSTEGTEGAGFLGHRNPTMVETGRIAFEQIWGERPRVPDWRRQAALSIADMSGNIGLLGGGGQATEQDGPPPLDLSDVPRTDTGRAELEERRAELRYELANALFLGLNLPDSARSVYQQILEETPDAPAAVKARYALAEIARQEEQTDVANTYLQQVADLANDEALREAALVRLGRIPDDQIEADSGAGRAFALAKQSWKEGRSEQAVQSFVAVADSFPGSESAPRALFAAAAVLIEEIPDARFDPLPQTAADSMVIGLARVPVPESELPAGKVGVLAPGDALDDVDPGTPPGNAGRPQPVTVVEADTARAIASPDSVARGRPLERVTAVPPVGPDSIVVAADSVLVAGAQEEYVDPDSIASPADAPGIVGLDSTVTQVDSAVVNSTNVVEERDPGERALALLDRLIEEYPESRPGERATAVRDLLSVRLGKSPAAETEPSGPETGIPPEATFGLYGDEPIRAEAGGYSLRVFEAPNRESTRFALMQLQREGVRAAMAHVGGEQAGYIVIAGQFETETSAQASVESLPAGNEMEVLQRIEPTVISLRGVEIVGDAPGAVEVDREILDRRRLE